MDTSPRTKSRVPPPIQQLTSPKFHEWEFALHKLKTGPNASSLNIKPSQIRNARTQLKLKSMEWLQQQSPVPGEMKSPSPIMIARTQRRLGSTQQLSPPSISLPEESPSDTLISSDSTDSQPDLTDSQPDLTDSKPDLTSRYFEPISPDPLQSGSSIFSEEDSILRLSGEEDPYYEQNNIISIYYESYDPNSKKSSPYSTNEEDFHSQISSIDDEPKLQLNVTNSALGIHFELNSEPMELGLPDIDTTSLFVYSQGDIDSLKWTPLNQTESSLISDASSLIDPSLNELFTAIANSQPSSTERVSSKITEPHQETIEEIIQDGLENNQRESTTPSAIISKYQDRESTQSVIATKMSGVKSTAVLSSGPSPNLDARRSKNGTLVESIPEESDKEQLHASILITQALIEASGLSGLPRSPDTIQEEPESSSIKSDSIIITKLDVESVIIAKLDEESVSITKLDEESVSITKLDEESVIINSELESIIESKSEIESQPLPEIIITESKSESNITEPKSDIIINESKSESIPPSLENIIVSKSPAVSFESPTLPKPSSPPVMHQPKFYQLRQSQSESNLRGVLKTSGKQPPLRLGLSVAFTIDTHIPSDHCKPKKRSFPTLPLWQRVRDLVKPQSTQLILFQTTSPTYIKNLSIQYLKPPHVVLLVAKDYLFMWVGSQSLPSICDEAFKHIKLQFPSIGHQLNIQHEGSEQSEFIQFFSDWHHNQSDESHLFRSQLTELYLKPNRIINDPLTSDHTPHSIEIWVVRDNLQLDSQEHGIFYDMESYRVLYSYRDNHHRLHKILFYWMGRSCQELPSSTDQPRTLVLQGEEPNSFMNLFQGIMVIKWGLRKSTGPRSLYHIQGQSAQCVQVHQTTLNVRSLCSGHCFILITKSTVYVWHGSGSYLFERLAARAAAHRLAPGHANIMEIQESNEPATFWSKLSARFIQTSYDTSSHWLRRPLNSTPFRMRLYRLAVSLTAGLDLREIYAFHQLDLHPGSVYLLDAYTHLFLWCQFDAKMIHLSPSHPQRQHFYTCLAITLDYAHQVDHHELRPIHLIPNLIQPGQEPVTFTSAFPSWSLPTTTWSQSVFKRHHPPPTISDVMTHMHPLAL